MLEPVARLTRHSRGGVKRVQYVEAESGFQVLYDDEHRPPHGILIVDCGTTQQLGVWMHVVSPTEPERDLGRYTRIQSKFPRVIAEWRHSSWPDTRDSIRDVHSVPLGYRFDITHNLRSGEKVEGQMFLNVYYMDNRVYSTTFELRGCK